MPSLTHDCRPSLRQLAGYAVVASSLFWSGCGPSPSFVGATTDTSGTSRSTSLSVPIPPSGGGSGDGAELLVAILGIQGNPSTSGPDGWTPVPGFAGFNGATCQGDVRGVACQLSAFYKLADGSETTADFTWNGTRGAAGAVVRYSNVDPDDPIGEAASLRGTSVQPRAPGVTTTQDGSRVLRIVAVELDEVKRFLTGSVALTDEAPTARLNVVSFPDAETDPTNGCGPPLSGCDATETAVALGVSDTRHTTAEPSGPANWELPSPDQWISGSIEIRRAPGP